jgi:hypothetical protein
VPRPRPPPEISNGNFEIKENMSYEELLRLEEEVGSVSKGYTEAQIRRLRIKPVLNSKTEEDE